MKTLRLFSAVSVALASLAAAPAVWAQDNGPCGRFDFTSGFDCEIRVEGGCKLDCTPLSFEAACAGGCTADATTTCTGSCEAQCNAQCDPGKLDCLGGCDAECESRCVGECNVSDCAEQCQSSCNANCKASCTGTAGDCQANCKECCHGACTTEVNINCDVDCYAKLQGGCEAQCEEPGGAIFCNGQYVGASDVDACIDWLLENYEIEVNASARGEVTCDLSGCEGNGNANAGFACATAPVGAAAGGSGAAAALLAMVGGWFARRRNTKKA